MSKRTNPTLVGGFVLGAVAIAVGWLVLLGAGDFMKERTHCIAFFEESLSGLDVGAPVEFRGVRVGTVTDIRIESDPNSDQPRIPVTLQLEPERVPLLDMAHKGNLAAGLKKQVANGLRVQLCVQSILTGKKKLVMDYHKDAPPRLIGNGSGMCPELPTVPSPLSQATRTLEELPMGEIVAEIRDALRGLSDLVNAPETKKAVVELNRTLNGIDTLVRNLDEKAGPLIDSLDARTEAANTGLSNTMVTVQELAAGISEQTTALLGELRKTAENINSLTDERSPFWHDLSQMLGELSAAGRSLRNVAEYLERHPEALLRGKQKGD